ncbi:PAS domain S-box protein [Flavisolibacter nicotianae]|uniref:PAS domain S-box protein n=1 Tax=Flavisolibacter nicotianae TaxID=2364882 RepID=UPI000EAF1156|nr:PAS domain S-box protein [Flavisolibacter nicotianae]
MIPNYQLLFETLGEAILTLDRDGFILYANPAAIQLTGYSIEELVNLPFRKLYPDDEDIVKAEYELDLAQKHGRFIVEGWRRRKDGSQFWSELTLSPIRQRNELAGFSCLLRNISEKKTHELNLRKSEERFRLMVEAVRDYAIFMLDPTGHIMSWNDGARRLKGYRADEVIGKHFSIFYTTDDLETEKPRRELEIAVATGKYEEEGWRIRKNGSLFWANILLTALFNEQNQLIGFSKVTRDLTERRDNEEVLRQSEERYRALVEQLNDYGIFMLDEKGRIVSWNEGARRINGYTAEEIIGKYFSIFYPEEDLISGKPAMELKVARAQGKYEEEGWRLRKDGTRFWASVVITAVYSNKGNHIGFSKVTRDLSERKEAERALKLSFERYRQLASELKEANTELQYANQELEQFTSIVSHDLQEPIRTIKSFLQLIELKLNQGQHDDLKTYINKSINAANRMRELIHNLLHYSQLNKNDVVVEKIVVGDLVNEVMQNLKTAIDASRAEVRIESDVEQIEGDRVQIVQLIQNLVSNALKFTKDNNPQVVIRCSRENGQVKFSVADNGIGIASGDMEKVFEIFRRLHTAKDYPGTGIGLAICKKIVDRHRGRIWPESEPGKGTTFYFTLNEDETTSLPRK